MKTYLLTALGCKVNQYEAAAVCARLDAAGLRPSTDSDRADLVVIHTCCVTTTAMRKSRNAIRRAVQHSPQATVFVVGCYGDYHSAAIRKLLEDSSVPPERICIAGHHQDLAACVDRLLEPLSTNHRSERQEQFQAAGGPEDIRYRRGSAVSASAPGADGLAGLGRFPGHQRAFVKVQDGCDAFCAYCIVPYTRPRVRSRPVEEIVTECRNLVDAGHREIVLSGVFLGAFGRTSAVRRRWNRTPSALPDLVTQVAEVPRLWRVRLSSLEPGDLDEALLQTVSRIPQVAPHLHLPLQSGSERILKRMNRQYTPDDYRRTVDRLAATLDRPAITADIIVGFPGESDADFEATLAMVRHAGFARVHAFPFSAIEGTAAWTYRHQAPPRDEVRTRLKQLKRLTDQTARSFRAQFVGRTLEALVEDRPASDACIAMTDRYMTVRLKEDVPPGEVISVHVDTVTDDALTAHRI